VRSFRFAVWLVPGCAPPSAGLARWLRCFSLRTCVALCAHSALLVRRLGALGRLGAARRRAIAAAGA